MLKGSVKLPDAQSSGPQYNAKLFRQIILLNVFILFILFVKVVSPSVAFFAGLLVLAYYLMLSVSKPSLAFFMIIGTKLTFDALWDARIEGIPFGLLELSIVPVIFLVLSAFRMKHKQHQWVIVFSLFYIFLTVFAPLLNDLDFDYKLLIRQSGILIGLLFGLRFIRNADDFKTAINALLISTVVPVIATIIQFLLGRPDISIFHVTLDSVREYRYSGLYYDAATNGMTNIVALFSSAYVVQSEKLSSRLRYLLYWYLVLTTIAVILGATRSILIITSLIYIIFFLKNIKKAFILSPALLAVLYFMQPYLERVVVKSTQEIRGDIQFTKLLSESEYRGLFTGRMSTWQDIWDQFNAGDLLQQLFGSGLNSNAHSTYFFLLLQIGWLGLIFYIIIHLRLLLTIMKSPLPSAFKNIAILSLFAILMMGMSASVVTYTSFQWITYFLIGGIMGAQVPLRPPAHR